MKTGSLEGFVDRTWQVVHDSGELAAAVTSYTISGLDGDTDVKYRLISRVVAGANTVGVYIRPNNDSGLNYGIQYVRGYSSSTLADRQTGEDGALINYVDATGRLTMSDYTINAKSGTVRTFLGKQSWSVNGTAIESVILGGNSWNNSADNITSLVLFSNQASGIGIGSRFILLKEVRVPSGLRTGELDIRGTLKGAWQEVYRHTVTGSAETSITVSGLLGNTLDQILRIRIRYVNGYNGANSYFIRLNGSDANYGYQYLHGSNTTVSALRGTESRINPATNVVSALNQISHEEVLLYAKTGFPRTAIVDGASGISGTTVSAVDITGSVWNETTTELTSFRVIANSANGLGIGTIITVERLNL